MGKMANRRRKAKKNKKTISKLQKSLEKSKINLRVPVPPVGSAFKSKKDYNRQELKQALKKAEIDE